MDKVENEEKRVESRKERIREVVRKTVAIQFGLGDGDQFDDSSSFIEDLGGDSLDYVEFLMNIEAIFNVAISAEDEEKLRNTADVVDYLMAKDAAKTLVINESEIPQRLTGDGL